MHADVLIVGGGLVGLASALSLARAGARVTLLERDICGRHASGLNAGGLRRVNRHPAEFPLAELAHGIWPLLADQLGRDVGHRAVGHLLLAEDEAEFARLAARPRFPCEHLLDAAALRDLCPGLAEHPTGALYAADDGYAHPGLAVVAFRDAAEAAGVGLRETTRLVALRQDGAAWRAETTGGAVAAGLVVNAAGAWAGEVASMAGEALPIEMQAPIAAVTAPLPVFLRPVVQTLTRRLTLKQMPDGRAWIGGGHRATPDPAGIALDPAEAEANLATAASLFAGLHGVRPQRVWAAADGYTPDRVAILGRLRPDGLLHACGFSGHGFQLAPAVGMMVSRLAAGLAPGADITGLAPQRFADAGGRDANHG
jgi:sarcosine oxidase subunit beta